MTKKVTVYDLVMDRDIDELEEALDVLRNAIIKAQEASIKVGIPIHIPSMGVAFVPDRTLFTPQGTLTLEAMLDLLDKVEPMVPEDRETVGTRLFAVMDATTLDVLPNGEYWGPRE